MSKFLREDTVLYEGEEASRNAQKPLLADEQVRPETQTSIRRHQLLALQSANAAVTSSLDIRHVLATLTRELANLLEMKACILSGWKPASGTLAILARHGPDDWWTGKWSAEVCRLADYTWIEPVLRDRCARQIAVEQTGSKEDGFAWLRRLGIQRMVMLPMVYQDRVVGLVEAMDDRPGRTLAEEEILLAQLLADQAASAVENTRLYDALRWHVAQATTLNKIGQVITSILDLRETLAFIADQARLLLDVAAASVVLREVTSGEMWFGAASGEGSEFVRGRRLARGHGIVDWVLGHGEPLTVPDVTQDPRFFAGWDKEGSFTTRSILCVPLKTKGQTIGAIEAINKASGPFDQEDLTLLTSIAASAAIAIENARLFDQAQGEIAERRRVETELRRVNRALRTLSECNETLARAQEESELLCNVCRVLVEVGGYRRARVSLAEQNLGEDVHPVAQAGIGDDQLSTIALPLVADGQSLGALNILARETEAFDQQELELLQDLANNLVFGITALRTRIERDRAEEEIRHLYQELQDHANRLEETVAERTRQLQAERDRTQAILEAVGEAVIVTDLEGRIQYLNPAALALTGYSYEEAVGRSPTMWQEGLSPSEDGDGRSDVVHDGESRAENAFQMQRAEVVSRRKDGTLYDAAMAVAPLFDSQKPGRIIGHVCVQRDISPIKEAERLKDQFVSNVSHELRTPLSVIALISGNLDRLYERLDDDRRRKMIQDIREHAQVLNDLISDILEISRIEGGRISMERQRVDLAHLAREEAGRQQPLTQRKSQALRVAGVEHLVVWGNEDQLRLVVRNLLNNAIKYTAGRGRIVCECSAIARTQTYETEWPGSVDLPPGNWAAFRVVDTGIGISPEDLPHVYDRFYRVRTEGNIPGTGLGLSIAKEMIESHGGHIDAASTPGKGSVFAVYLPLLEE